MTQMTIPQTAKPSAALSLGQGETRSWTAGDGAKVMMFWCGGGAFIRVDTRDAKGQLVADLSKTCMWEHEALPLFARALDALS